MGLFSLNIPHMSTRDTLLAQIDAYLERTKMSPRSFSLLVGRDHKWLSRLRRGMVTLQSIERAEAVLRGEITQPLPPKRSLARTHPSEAA
jgi:hypothetical protein